MSDNYFGKYRAIVTDINDPDERDRIRVICPKVLGESKSKWCEICIPVAYDSGGDFCLPKIGESVWVEFEGGDVNKPIYVGSWRAKSKPPKAISDYKADSAVTRVIEFDGCNLVLKKDLMTQFIGECEIKYTPNELTLSAPLKMTLKVGSTTLVITPTNATLISDTINFVGVTSISNVTKDLTITTEHDGTASWS